MEEEFTDETIREIKNTIQKTEIKNALSKAVEKFTNLILKFMPLSTTK